MKIFFHVWNLILFKGQKYHEGSLASFLFCIVKRQCRTVLSTLLSMWTRSTHHAPQGITCQCGHMVTVAASGGQDDLLRGKLLVFFASVSILFFSLPYQIP